MTPPPAHFRRSLRCLLVTACMALTAAIPAFGSDYSGPIEGVWQTSDGGAVFEVKAAPGVSGSYILTIVYSDDYTAMPGTIFGSMTATAKPGVYDARMRLSLSDREVSNPSREYRDVIVELTEEGRMTFTAYSRSKRISLRRWLPYLFRVSVVENATRPEGIDGAVRIDPPGTPALPVVL